LTPDELIIRGERAKQLLAEPLIADSLKRLETDIFEAWSRTGIRDKEGQHELLLMIQTARKFRAILEQVMVTGEVEAKNLQTPKLRRTLERFGVYNP
jgi:hypothetical protein